MMKARANQRTWLANVVASNGGKPSGAADGSVLEATSADDGAEVADEACSTTPFCTTSPLVLELVACATKTESAIAINLQHDAPEGPRSRHFSSTRSDGVKQHERDNERENGQSFGHGEAEDQVRELASGRRRI